MLTKFHKFISIFKSMGPGWIAFRVAYSFRTRTGLIKRQVPAYPWKKYSFQNRVIPGTPLELNEYKRWKCNYYSNNLHLFDVSFPERIPWDPHKAVQEANRYLQGEVKYFDHLYQNLGFPPDWLLDPFSNIKYDPAIHWSEIPDYGKSDIKFVWEANRFSQIYILVRAFTVNRDEKYPQAFWTILSDWMQKNPPGLGPNWKDGQEVALRLMAATFGYLAFLNSDSSIPQHVEMFSLFVAAHAQRIYQNIDFAISTKSNHTISEAFGLWLTGTLFPELKYSNQYLRVGRDILENQIRNQFFEDGGYAMYSINYQRFVLHLYLVAIHLGEKAGKPFSQQMVQIFTKSIEFLYHIMDHQTGEMPQFGSNDGALILPLNNCDFSDYRPLVQAGYYLIHKERLFPTGEWDEDLFWLFGPSALEAKIAQLPIRGKTDFPEAGIYLLESDHSRMMIRCVDFQSRPSHADQLHLELSWYGKSVTCDAGTYLYHGHGVWDNGLSGSAVHNTVTVDNQDQMTRLSRITWLDWTKGQVFPARSEDGIQVWNGNHNGYQRLKDPVDHQRSIFSLGHDRWLVLDHLQGTSIHAYRLHWLLADFPYRLLDDDYGLILDLEDYPCKVQIGSSAINGNFSILRGDPQSTRGWCSRYYAHKEEAISLALDLEQRETFFWTFFGHQDDEIIANDHQIKITYDGKTRQINFFEI
ncbi:MAG: alginate lyase family protein [Anaerolineaceae bacterium]